MAVLIDPPAWPAHGTTWSHLVSDRSYEELHRFAARLGIPRRAFDLDHYDVPADRYADAVTAGADRVGGRDLTRRLIGSGLRVAGRDRPVLKALRRRWLDLMPGEYEVGDDLLVRWREPHRVYHGPRHLADVLDAAQLLWAVDLAGMPPDRSNAHGPDRMQRDARVVGLALWFHDAVHAGVSGRDEAASAELVADLLAGRLPAPTGTRNGRPPADSSRSRGFDDTWRVAALVRMTATHDPGPSDRLGALVSDADLAILAAAPERYAQYVRHVRAEYAHVDDDTFREGRILVLNQLLALPSLYRTPYARRRWHDRAARNLQAELAKLHSSSRG